jgi:hypothetical protein
MRRASTGFNVALVACSLESLLGSATKQITDLQTKVYQLEIWSCDEFVRKGSFELVVARPERSMEAMGVKIEAAVDKMTAKVDAFQHHQMTHHRD